MESPGRLLTVRQGKEITGLSTVTMYRWIAERRIACVRLGSRALRIPESEIRRLISDGLVPARPGIEG
jgi:excisionase family DNA binding protein